ncbi:hypothetical protein GCM10022254_64270 [Actinomadura meridiana]|uniref:Lipoprotein n=1 Tax=Actinomadura meridiana TaxID=559626 RepID=A0ABP8CK86_9ACTN
MGISWPELLRTRLPLLAAAALPLTACGPLSDTTAASTSSPLATPAPPSDGGYYNAPRTIVEKAAGSIPCSDLTETENVIGAREQVTCSDGNIVIRVHDNHQGVDGQLDMMKLTGGDLLTGQNWTVNASPAILRAARVHLGGKITHIPCEPPACALERSP